MIPKSLHTVTALVNVARHLRASDGRNVAGATAADEMHTATTYVHRALLVLGYGTGESDAHGLRQRAVLLTLLPVRA